MNKKEFAKWAKVRKQRVVESTKYVCTVAENCTTICIDTVTGDVGIARLHPDDEYDFATGVAIAYARCRGEKVPKITIYKKLSEMKNGEIFKGTFGATFRYIGKNEDTYVVYDLKFNKYRPMPFDVEYEMVE